MLTLSMPFTIPGASAGAPHDPAVDSKGVSWFTDQGGSRIGFWDPATGDNMVWPTPTQPCRTHGLVPDDKDNIWYTGQGCNKIGKLDRATGMITEYTVPGGGGPHTPIFHKGAIWFTIQGGDRFGRVDPVSGEVKTWAIGPGPYGMWAAPDGSIWVALFGTNRLAQINPENPDMPPRQVTLPNGGSRPRRIAVDKNGHVYYTDYPRGILGRFDSNAETPDNARFKEWLSPKGMGPGPYGITVGPPGDDRIYYYQGNSSIAVFNPKTEKFDQVVPLGVQVDAVRHMQTDNVRRRVWLGLAGARRMAYIQVP
jgi:virginiamycin B lyase